MKKINHLKIGIRTIKIEAKGLDKLAETMGNEFNNVCCILEKIDDEKHLEL